MPALIGIAAKAAMVGSVALAPAPAHTHDIVVKHNDTLSALATRDSVPGGWPSLYAANQKVIGSDPDLIIPGQKLTIPAKIVTAAVIQPRRITVKKNDSLTVLSVKYKIPGGWDSLFAANPSLSNPNVLNVGQSLTLPDHAMSRPWSAPAPAPAPVATTASDSAAPVQQAPNNSAPVSHQTVHANSSFQQCVISRESGGNPDVMNSSGHYGLYQFSESTWVAYGGNAGDFGNASADEQTRVFNNAMATAGGASNWSPYDGC